MQADIVLHTPEEKVLEAFDFEGKDLNDVDAEAQEFFGEGWQEYNYLLRNLEGFSKSWNSRAKCHLEDIVAAVTLMTKYDLPAEIACDLVDDQGADYAVSWHEDNFLGTEVGPMGDIAQQWFEEIGDIPNESFLAKYIDWERVERDLFLGGDWSYYETEGTRYIYMSN